MDIRSFIATQLILAAQRTRFRGVGGYTPAFFREHGDSRPFPQAQRECEAFRDFFAFFAGLDLAAEVRGKEVLDFGSGYGGRTVEYARIGAKHIIGVEIPGEHVALSRDYAESLGVNNASFLPAAVPTRIPLPDASVDVVVSYDVLEHVQSPPASMQELRRVLRPGGKAFLVFPVYFGARSHHLDYLTTLPGLHWVFSADRLVRAVNRILAAHAEFGIPVQPAPKRSFDGSHDVLPALNGLSGKHLPVLFQDFQVLQIRRHVILRSRPAAGKAVAHFARLAPVWLADAVTDSVSCVLMKANAVGGD
jgi:SAM-dependent methyltransferase